MVAHFAGVALLLIIHLLPFSTPSFLEVIKKKKTHIKQPDVSPVSSVIHKTPNTPHSSLMLYEKLKLNQGSVIKLSDFCWIRMNSCVCHIVCWKCAWGACGLGMHIYQLLVEMDLLTMGHDCKQPGTSAPHVEPSRSALDAPGLTDPYKWARETGHKEVQQQASCLCSDRFRFQRGNCRNHLLRGPGRSGTAVRHSEDAAVFCGCCETELLIRILSHETFRSTTLAWSLSGISEAAPGAQAFAPPFTCFMALLLLEKVER